MDDLRERDIQVMTRAVLDHAERSQCIGGWDFIFECWDEAEIATEIKRSGEETVEDAIEHFERIAARHEKDYPSSF